MKKNKSADVLTCDCGKKFALIPIEIEFYNKNKLPNPAKCPECRQYNRLSLSRSRALSGRKCDKCNKEILSVYPEDSDYKIYCQECYWKTM